MAELNNMQLRQKIADLLSKEKLAVLASWDGKQPYNTLVAFIFTEDLKSILFATREDTQKYQNIAKYPYVSLLIDNRTNDKKDFKDAVALTVSAKAKPIAKQAYVNLTSIAFLI